MQTICDKCKDPVRKVGRLTRVTVRGLTQKLCKGCKRSVKMSYH